MRGNWDKVNHAIRDALGQVTLVDMAPCMPFPVPGEPAVQNAH
jgi:hypothetical protein